MKINFNDSNFANSIFNDSLFNNESLKINNSIIPNFPNPTICYDITDLHGEWKDLGLTCVNDKNKNSFRAQYASVFRHPLKKDLYIALGDRWLTDCTEDMVDMEQVFLSWFKEGEGLPLPREERWLMSELDVSLATYVWLPISFKADGTPYIEWKREWKTENFE